MSRSVSLMAMALLLGLGGCGTINAGYSTLQFNGDTLPFPTNYAEIATEAVASHKPAGDIDISYPEQIPGEGVFDKRRWYVCVRGLQPQGERVPSKPLFAAEDLFGAPAKTGVFEAIVVFSRTGNGNAQFTFDAPLCRNVNYGKVAT